MWTDIAQRHMNVEIGAEAAQFPEKEHINGIAVAVRFNNFLTAQIKRTEEQLRLAGKTKLESKQHFPWAPSFESAPRWWIESPRMWFAVVKT
jgi:hypothetical protein